MEAKLILDGERLLFFFFLKNKGRLSRCLNEKIMRRVFPIISILITASFITKRTRTTICLDCARGKYGSSGVFFGLNEVF